MVTVVGRGLASDHIWPLAHWARLHLMEGMVAHAAVERAYSGKEYLLSNCKVALFADRLYEFHPWTPIAPYGTPPLPCACGAHISQWKEYSQKVLQCKVCRTTRLRDKQLDPRWQRCGDIWRNTMSLA